MKNDNYNKINYIIEKNLDKNLNIEKINNNIQNKEYLYKVDKTNLSDILNAIKSARSVGSSQQQGGPTPQIQTANIPQPARPNNTIVPSTVATAANLWSPQSLSGVVYKYNRGVIGIEIDGTKHEIIFDGTNRHHNEATAEIGRLTNCPVQEAWNNPFINGMEVGKQGTIIIQLEGDSILVYLPEMISQEQYQSLEEEVYPRRKFSTVAFTHGDDVYDDAQVNVEYLRNFYSNIVGEVKRSTR